MPHMTGGQAEEGGGISQETTTGFGEPSQERAGTHERKGMAFRELNALEIERGMRVDWDPIAGRPRSVVYRVDPDVSGLEYESRRDFEPDTSTEGAQPSDAAYRGSGLERGHLGQREASKGSVEAEQAADLMTNVVPMTQQLNRGAGSGWRQQEATAIRLAGQTGQSYTVEVRPIYEADPPRLPDGTPIPKQVVRITRDANGTVVMQGAFDNY